MSSFDTSPEQAAHLDQNDPLRGYRKEFHFPKHEGKEVLYFCGNSLGLQPKQAQSYLQAELDDWANMGVEGHTQARHPWLSYHKTVQDQIAELCGAKQHEVVVMNALTVNLNLMMVSFYRPTPQRYKIVLEARAFPSDQYAAEMQARFHGYDPADAILELPLREGEFTHRTEDILKLIQEQGSQIALILIGGVNYYSGQFFELDKIAEAGRRAGAVVGFDLAHAIGNVPLKLHEWGPDFAVWCSYKYLNSGPGGVSGVFVHERHELNQQLPRFAGWWGNDEGTRFQMRPGFEAQRGAAGWQMSNAPVLPMAVHRASLDLFHRAGMEALRHKSEQLSGYLLAWLEHLSQGRYEVLTPRNPKERGCQLSVRFASGGRAVFDALSAEGVMADWREPDVIRLAPVPLYNSFNDVYAFAQILKKALSSAPVSSLSDR